MGVENGSRRDQPWNDCSKVRCGVSVSCGIAAVPPATTTGESSGWGGSERVSWEQAGRASHASQSAKFECQFE
jgi:hypothetical protein